MMRTFFRCNGKYAIYAEKYDKISADVEMNNFQLYNTFICLHEQVRQNFVHFYDRNY